MERWSIGKMGFRKNPTLHLHSNSSRHNRTMIWMGAISNRGGFSHGSRHAHVDRSIGKGWLLARITKPVDPRTQMGALLWQARDRGLLFENLPGYPGWRCLGQAPGDVSLAPVAFDTARATRWCRNLFGAPKNWAAPDWSRPGRYRRKFCSATKSTSPRCRFIRRAYAMAGRLSALA